jgi:hypothetical protein
VDADANGVLGQGPLANGAVTQGVVLAGEVDFVIHGAFSCELLIEHRMRHEVSQAMRQAEVFNE